MGRCSLGSTQDPLVPHPASTPTLQKPPTKEAWDGASQEHLTPLTGLGHIGYWVDSQHPSQLSRARLRARTLECMTRSRNWVHAWACLINVTCYVNVRVDLGTHPRRLMATGHTRRFPAGAACGCQAVSQNLAFGLRPLEGLL